MLLLALVALGVPLALSLRDRVDAEIKTQAANQASVVAATAADSLTPLDYAAVARLARAASRNVRGRVILVDSRGRLIADSAPGTTLGADYSRRPEIAAALRGRAFQGRRHSKTLNADLLVTATPIIHRGRTVGAARVTQSVTAVDRAVNRNTGSLALIGLLVLALGLGAGALIASEIARPLRRLEAVADRVSHGDLGARAVEEGASEQRSLARSFNDMTARIAALLGAQREFVADASHQLRTPLTGLRLRVEEAEAQTGDDAVRRELEHALGEVDRLSRTIDDLLVLSRAGERDAPSEAVDLGALARTTAERWGSAAAVREQSVKAETAGGSTVGSCPRADLERALDAVVENALAYSPDGADVVIRARPGAIEVLDRGPGLAAGEEEHVFARFHRGDAGRRGPAGTGLGLAIVRELVRGWGGDATLANRPGGGLVATLTVPEG